MEKYHFSPPVLAIINGVSGSGKRFLYEALLNQIMATPIDKDRINDLFTTKRDGWFYQKFVIPFTYKLIDFITGYSLNTDRSVLIRATYSTEVQNLNWAQRYVRMTQNLGAEFRLIRCVAPEDEIRRRIEERGLERDKPKLENWEGFMKREPIHVPMPAGSIEVETSNGLEQTIEIALDYLKNGFK